MMILKITIKYLLILTVAISHDCIFFVLFLTVYLRCLPFFVLMTYDPRDVFDNRENLQYFNKFSLFFAFEMIFRYGH